MNINLLSTSTSRPIEWIRQSSLRINQALSYINSTNNRTEINSDYTIKNGDYYIAVMGGHTVTLSGAEKSRKIIIKDEAGTAGTSPITVAGTIDGVSNYVINTDYGSLRLISDGTNWFLI